MKKFSIFIGFLTLLVLAACGNAEQKENSNSDEMPAMVEVEVKLPEHAEPNKKVKIEAFVTQGEEKVDDASEVKFEIWKKGQEENHEMVEASNDGDGIYSIEKTFKEEAVYYVVAHTTAREMHVMPRVEFTVGHPEDTEHDHEEEGHDHKEHEKTDHHNEDSHGHDNTLTMNLLTDAKVSANKETTLTTELTRDGAEFEGANVRFEVWHEDSENHVFIDAKEVSEGVYEAKATLKETGLHYVQIHVEKDELHEHQKEEVEVE
ncbi:hypothetical protein FIU87_05730 [Bacillus sp. THAF10]|uniref:FixH family protein n=1 Tax=Bacillus sp. THAF10 TaxID=2587848 RepID=UPI0012684FB1|nr:FixH family protein [Bacillus sp. THAF10]QFT88132.1 hypothetical protein FIU87_05730 [Bacillus sp. THAF10]